MQRKNQHNPMTMAVFKNTPQPIGGAIQPHLYTYKAWRHHPKHQDERESDQRHKSARTGNSVHQGSSALKNKQIVVEQHSVWKTRESNTSAVMQATGGGNKRAMAGPDGSHKKGKNDNAVEPEDMLLDPEFITTEINEKKFDLIPEVEAEGATMEQLKDIKQGFFQLVRRCNSDDHEGGKECSQSTCIQE